MNPIFKVLLCICALSVSGAGAAYAGASANKIVPINGGEWRVMENQSSYARNFQHKAKSSTERFDQVVTVFDLPMTDDRRLGHKDSKDEYIEIFKIGAPSSITFPNDVVVQIKLDKGDYWLLSRQTFIVGRHLAELNPEENENSYLIFRSALQDEIDKTRYQLRNAFK